MIQRLHRYVRADKLGPREYGEYIVAYHVRPMVARGLNLPPGSPLPRHYSKAYLSSPAAGWPRQQAGHVIA